MDENGGFLGLIAQLEHDGYTYEDYCRAQNICVGCNEHPVVTSYDARELRIWNEHGWCADCQQTREAQYERKAS